MFKITLNYCYSASVLRSSWLLLLFYLCAPSEGENSGWVGVFFYAKYKLCKLLEYCRFGKCMSNNPFHDRVDDWWLRGTEKQLLLKEYDKFKSFRISDNFPASQNYYQSFFFNKPKRKRVLLAIIMANCSVKCKYVYKSNVIYALRKASLKHMKQHKHCYGYLM